ncbi:aminotransferase class V-fold PLP-dependent enzyme [Kroppenstedtia pulmonis]|uniref:cysteine desulfurase n=1 Tax=Kroppenstedtia pulmonis TaxID=1380685 RepID=A0A7D4BHE5_9BACL|nr:aminotransferase class V-fold PLP-dependent enzyme [Kroppenstedtia pulmonis]QKG85812.1 aminotransferase class V-fold PLP-dependent enzyme [Kroppenstedtia pulmonis]
MIYLDNAATTWPKPKTVVEAMKQCVEEYGANPGRGNHRLSRIAGEKVEKTRYDLAQLFQIPDPNNLFFCVNGTLGINLGLKGVLRPGDHVIATRWEHNAVARPLESLKEEKQIQVSYLSVGREGEMDLHELEKCIRRETRLMIVTHGSNVTGTVLPIQSISRVLHRHGVWLMVDAAQTAGILDLNVQEMGIDILVAPGHKGLLGPQGTGFLYVHPDIPIQPVIQGGTGIRSESLEQDAERPYGFESGTLNTPGIAGLGAGIRFLNETGLEKIYSKEMALTKKIEEGLREIRGVILYTPNQLKLPVISFEMENLDSIQGATLLDQHYQICVRGGFHCAALAHQENGTASSGTIRISPGYFNTEQDAEVFLQAVAEISTAFVSG